MTIAEQNALFDRWIHQHAAVLHHVANGFAEGVDRSDLMQELLLAVWRAIPNFRGGAQTSTFMYRVAHNAALTWRRTQRNYRDRISRFEHAIAPSPTTSPGTDRDREALAHLYAAIRQLAPVERSLVLLHLDGLSYAEIGDIHGLTESNVGARLSRLRNKLSQALEALTHELR